MIKVKVRTALLANTFIVYDPRGLTLRLIEVGCRHWIALLLVGIEREEVRITRKTESFCAARVVGHLPIVLCLFSELTRQSIEQKSVPSILSLSQPFMSSL